MRPVHRFLVVVVILCNSSLFSFAQCDSTGLAADSLQWVVDGPTGSPSVGGTYRLLSSIKKYKDTLYLGGGFDYVGRYTGSCAGFNTNTGEYVNMGKWPRINGIVRAIISDGNGGVVVLGKFTRAGDSLRQNVVHIDSAYNVTALKANANDTVLCGIVHNGKLYIGGKFTTVNSVTRNGAAAFNLSTGALDNNWNPNTGHIYCMDTDGTDIYVGGSFSTISGVTRKYLASLNATTAAATGFNQDINSIVKSIKIYNGRIYFGGTFSTVSGNTRNSLASVTLATNTLNSWNPNVTRGGSAANITSMDVSANKIYIVGMFDKIGTTNKSWAAAIDTGTALPTNWAPYVGGSSLPGWGVLNGFSIRSIKVAGSKIYICGRFTFGLQMVNSTLQQLPRIHFASFDTSSNYVNNLAINGYYNTNTDSNYTFAECLNVIDGELYIGGKFGSFGGHQRRRLAAIDLVNNKILETFNPSIPQGWSYIEQLEISQDTIYAAGYLDSVNGIAPTGYISRFAINSGYSFSSVPIPWALTRFKINGNYIYGVGDFYFTSGFQTYKYIARFNRSSGNQDYSWAPNFSTNSSAIGPHDVYIYDSLLLLTGSFSQGTFIFPSVFYHYLSSTSTGTLTYIPKTVWAMAATGSKVYMGGNIVGTEALDTATFTFSTTWKPNIGVRTGLGINYSTGVFAMEADKGRVYLGGGFDTVKNQLRGSFAVVDTITGSPYPWKVFLGWKNWFGSPYAAEFVRDIELAGDTVFVAGDFNDLNGTNMAGLARFHYNNFTEPQVVISANDTSVCSGVSVTVTANVSQSGATYQWKKNGVVQTGSGSTFSFTPVDNDTITCHITVSGSGCYLSTTASSNPLIFDVIANTNTTLSISLSDDTVCVNDTVHLSVTTNITGATYQWKVGTTNVGTNIDTYSYVPSNGDVVSCTVEATTGCYSPDSSVLDTMITVHADTVTNIAITANTNPFCPGDDDTLTATANIMQAIYQWRVNGSNIIGATSNSYAYTPANNDMVECVVTASSPGCYQPDKDTSNVITLTALTPDTAKISIVASSNPVPCIGISDTFTATTAVANPTYAWKVNGSPAGGNNSVYSYTPANNDVVTCNVIATASACFFIDTVTSNSITVSVTQPPAITTQPADIGLSDGKTAQFTVAASGTGLSYQWQVNTGSGFVNVVDGGQYSGAQTNTLTVSGVSVGNNTNRFRCIVAVGSCPQTSGEAQLTVFPVGISGPVAEHISVYPNPVNDAVTITADIEISKVEIVNYLGQQVHNETVSGKRLVIDMQQYTPGVYLLKVNDKYLYRLVKN